MKKGRYIYYHCTGYRGKCALPYFREEKLGARLGQVLKDIYIPDDVLGWLQGALLRDQDHMQREKRQQQQRLQRRLADVRRRIDQAYLDKLDGKISEEFWSRKTREWNLEEQQVLLAIRGLEEVKADRMRDHSPAVSFFLACHRRAHHLAAPVSSGLTQGCFLHEWRVGRAFLGANLRSIAPNLRPIWG